MLGSHIEKAVVVENPPGISRRTLVYNDQAMLCHFDLKRGAEIPLHDHQPVQIGYVISGRVRFHKGLNGETFIAAAGDSYVFGPNEPHGAEALEDSVYIEVFSPSRSEYA